MEIDRATINFYLNLFGVGRFDHNAEFIKEGVFQALVLFQQKIGTDEKRSLVGKKVGTITEKKTYSIVGFNNDLVLLEESRQPGFDDPVFAPQRSIQAESAQVFLIEDAIQAALNAKFASGI